MRKANLDDIETAINIAKNQCLKFNTIFIGPKLMEEFIKLSFKYKPGIITHSFNETKLKCEEWMPEDRIFFAQETEIKAMIDMKKQVLIISPKPFQEIYLESFCGPHQKVPGGIISK